MSEVHGPCGFCGQALRTGARRDRVYCSDACQRRAWAASHRLAERKRCRVWRGRNRELSRLLQRAWRERNKERVRAYAREWARRNRDLLNFHLAARRARTRATVSGPAFRAAVAGLPQECAYCGRADVPLTLDHRMPLSRGGSHDPQNIIPACRSCNSRKWNRDELEFRALLALEAFVEARRRRLGESQHPYRAGRPCRNPRHGRVPIRDTDVGACDVGLR